MEERLRKVELKQAEHSVKLDEHGKMFDNFMETMDKFGHNLEENTKLLRENAAVRRFIWKATPIVLTIVAVVIAAVKLFK